MASDSPWQRRRLGEVAAGAPFGSTGSVGDFALAQSAGPRPLGLVSGIAVEVDREYGVAPVRPGTFREGSFWRARWGLGAELALERLRAQATSIGADLGARRPAHGRAHPHPRRRAVHAVKFVLAGNAMRASDRRTPGALVLSGLSAAEHLLLERSAGHTTAGVCVAAAKYTATMTRRSAAIATRAAHPARDRLLRRSRGRPQQLPDLAATVSQARHAIVDALAAHARRLRADGIIDVRVELDIPRGELSWSNRHFAIAATAIATAIAAGRTAPIRPATTIDLDGGGSA